MRYKLDNAGYVCAVAFGCLLDNCTEYTGAVPTGYNNLDEWATYACIQAYYIDENGNLTLDGTRKTELENRQAQEAIDYAPLVRKDLYETNEVLDSQYARNRVIGKVITLEDIKTISPIGIITGIQAYECKKIRLLTQGKNMLNCTAKTIIFSGVGFGVNPDGSLTVTGKATEDIEYIIAENDYLFSLKANEKYHLNLGGLDCELRYSNNGEIAQQYIGSSGLITVPNHIEVSQVVLKIPSGQSVNITFHPQLEHGNAFTSYESYKCKVTEIDLSPYLADVLYPEETLYPSDTLFPRHSTTINYIIIKDGSIVVSIDGIPTVIGSGSFGLFSNYSTIYADKDVMLEVEYSENLLDVESLEFLQGKATTTNKFQILKDGSIEAHNGYFSGKIECDSGYFKGEIEAKKGKIGGLDIGNASIHSGKTSLISSSSGVYIGTDGISVGRGRNAPAFKITSDGDITINSSGSIRFTANALHAMQLDGYGINFGSTSSYTTVITDSKIKVHDNYIDSEGLHCGGYNDYTTIIGAEIEIHDSIGSVTINSKGMAFGLDTDPKIYHGATHFMSLTDSYVKIYPQYTMLGSSTGYLGFFGSTKSSYQKSVSTITTTSSATASTVATKLNEVINALKAYNLIG